MDFLQQFARQFADLYRGMPSSQRMTLTVVPLLVLAGFGWLMMQDRSTNGYSALSWGKVYTTEELIAAEQALLQDGLKDFRREGQRLLVPASDIDKYNAALLKFDAMPADLGGQMLKQYESMGPFSTEKERQERKDALLLQEARRILRAIPEIQDARVAIASSGRRSWSQKTRVTANVTVTTRGSRELSTRLARSIQAALASMVPDLNPSDVTVFDVLHGVTHKGEGADDPFDSQLLGRIKEFQQTYQDNIQRDLSYIPDVGVTVNVDVDNLKSSVIRNQVIDPKKTAAVYTQDMKINDAAQQQPARGEPGQVANRPGSVGGSNGIERTRTFKDESNQTLNGVSFETAEKQLIAAMPKAVQVSVAVPRDYYRSVVAKHKAAGETDAAKLDLAAVEKEVLANVAKSVKSLIPVDSPATAVTVTTIDRVTDDNPIPTLSFMDQLNDLVKQWGSTIGLAIFAIVALVMLRRAAPVPAAEPTMDFSPAALQRSRQTAQEQDEAPREVTQRDSLQGLVRDNPEATAAIISRWLQAAK